MRILFLLLIITTIFTACSKDDDKTFIENLEGEYAGTYKTYNCALAQMELSSEASTATITKTSDTEIDVNVSTFGSTSFNFSATVNADSTFTIPEFMEGQETYRANIIVSPKMKILFGNGCMLLGDEIATAIFEED